MPQPSPTNHAHLGRHALSVYVEEGYCEAKTAAVAAVMSAVVSSVHESTPTSAEPAPGLAVLSAGLVDAELVVAGGTALPALVALPPQSG